MKLLMKNILFYLIIFISLHIAEFLALNTYSKIDTSKYDKSEKFISPKIFYEGWFRISSRSFLVKCIKYIFLTFFHCQNKKKNPPIPVLGGKIKLAFLNNGTSKCDFFYILLEQAKIFFSEFQKKSFI